MKKKFELPEIYKELKPYKPKPVKKKTKWREEEEE